MASDRPEPRHEVYVDPGWPTEQRLYIGPDAYGAAMAYGSAVTAIAGTRSNRYEIIWTVDGVVHQHERGGIVAP